MNLSRFNGAIWALKTELESNSILDLTDKMASALGLSVSQPSAETSMSRSQLKVCWLLLTETLGDFLFAGNGFFFVQFL